MPKFGKRSKERLETCDKRLQIVMNEVVKHVDISVLCGHRNKEDQNSAVATGNWGNDWDGDFSTKDTSFHDYPHFELKNE